MTPYYTDESVTIYHGDCRELLPELPKVDLVLTDPPYGMQYCAKMTPSKKTNARNKGQQSRSYGATVVNDDQPFDPAFLLHFPNIIIWGYQHMARSLPHGTVLVWVKRHDTGYGSFLSDADLAWKRGGCGVYCVRQVHSWAQNAERLHPTEKPLEVIRWCFTFYPDATSVLDPFMGSGTTLRAAKDLGLQAIGIEIEEKYCEIAAERMRQQSLFKAENGNQPEQVPMW